MNLYQSRLDITKSNIEIAFNNLIIAIERGEQAAAIECYEAIKAHFESLKAAFPQANIFQRASVNRYEKKIMTKAQSALAKKGWA